VRADIDAHGGEGGHFDHNSHLYVAHGRAVGCRILAQQVLAHEHRTKTAICVMT
jgi:hypothetical protein